MSKHAEPQTPIEFEPAFVAAVQDLFDEKIVFNKLMGVRLTEVRADGVRAHLAMKPELVGNYLHHRLHGGVVSACLDALAGMACMAASAARHMDEPPLQRLHRFSKLGTIDLRIDYLRPCVGEHFDLRAEVLRLGSRVATTRMEFLGADGKLLCVGAGAYIVS
ncbi:thioesterase family protein [Hydrogenophaga sp. BPS33]|uniref:thioesterase family protein n=1 Tax=Hydrogenophaga sp. BPS33 TaxID=2651974 RepID=UPI00131FC4E4|nr:thioesterase family protein [Hydrogenophaga sp. BPS33]QHE84432.1 thioesterase family protein [Hydrogenophaga sp. BPS33]